MSSSFAITTAANSTPLDGSRKGHTVFTVSNTSVRALRGRARIVPDKAAAATWFTLTGGAERDFSVNGTQQYTVQIAAPPTAAAGNYTVRLDMVGVDNPDEDFTPGPSVTIAVPAPSPVKKPFPWWIIAVVIGVVIVGIILASVLSPKQVEVPKLVGSPLIAAQPTLEAAGLKVNVVLATAESAKQNMVMAQDPAGGVKVQSGSGVTLTVGVAKPITSTPAPTTVPPTGTPAPTATPDRQTTTQLISSPAKSAARAQSVTIVAQIKTADEQPATGAVKFVRENGDSIPGCASPAPVNEGIATCVTNGLLTGLHAVTATYSGDANHNPSTSAQVLFTVTPANTSISLTAKSSPIPPFYQYSAVAKVTNTSSGAALIPSGTVTFTFGSGAIGERKTCTLDANGQCSANFQTPMVYQQVSATYSPANGDFNGSSAGPVPTGR